MGTAPTSRRSDLTFRQECILALVAKADINIDELVMDGSRFDAAANAICRAADAVVRAELQTRPGRT